MRTIYHLLVGFFYVLGIYQTVGQTTSPNVPKKFTYQSVVRDSSGQLITNNSLFYIFLIGLFTLITKIQVFGQSHKFEIGIEAFPNLSSLNGTEYNNRNFEPMLNFGAGIFFQYNVRKYFSLRTNIAYERKGSIQNLTGYDINGNPIAGDFFLSSNFDYTTIPLLFRFRFGNSFNFFINAGPYFGFLIKQIYKSDGVFPTPQVNEGTSFHKRFDLGLSTGLGFSLPVHSKLGFSFELRDNLGFYNVSKMPPPYLEKYTKTQSLNFIFGLNYLLLNNNYDKKKVFNSFKTIL